MKTTAIAEAMICVFSAIFEALPPHSRQRVDSILKAALSTKMIEDADAVHVLECLVDAVPRSRFYQ